MKSLEHLNSKTLTKLKTFYTFQSTPLQFPLSRINYHMIYEKIVKVYISLNNVLLNKVMLNVNMFCPNMNTMTCIFNNDMLFWLFIENHGSLFFLVQSQLLLKSSLTTKNNNGLRLVWKAYILVIYIMGQQWLDSCCFTS